MNNLILYRCSRKFSQIEYIFYIDGIAGSLCDGFAILFQDLYHTGTDCAVAHNCNMNHNYHSLANIFT